MKRAGLIVWCLLFSLLLISCGKLRPEGNIISKDISVGNFNDLIFDGKFRVFFTTSPQNFVNIETNQNIAENLKLKVNNGILTISEGRETKGVDFYNITIYSKNILQKISAADSVEVNISGAVKTDKLNLILNDNSKFIGSLNTKSANLEMSGKTRANLNGFSNAALIKISDTASLIAPYWKIGTLRLESQNENYAEVNAEDSLKGFIRNTAKLIYYNNPIRAIKIEKTANVQNKTL